MAQVNKNTIFIGDIPNFSTISDLQALFGRFGEILEVKIKYSVQNGKQLAYGFVSFKNEVSSKEAMVHMEGVVFCGRRLRLVNI